MAKKSTKKELTKLELKLMQVIWKHGRCTVGSVQEGLEPPLAYTTVQTMLNLLERKGKLKRELEGRAYVYSATITEARALGQGVRDLVDRMFGGSSEELVMSLLKTRQIDGKKLAALTEKFNKQTNNKETNNKETNKP